MDCIGKCKKGAIRYERPRKEVQKPVTDGNVKSVSPEQVDNARRAFFSAGAVFAASTLLKAQEKKVDGGLAVIEDKKIPERATPIVPAGSLGLRNFAQHCTACQLCVSVCPNQVLRPSGNLMTLMQPEMHTNAAIVVRNVRSVPRCARRMQFISQAWLINHLSRSVSGMDQEELCAADGWCELRELCPSLSGSGDRDVPSEPDNQESPKIPVVNVERCIGCGACENLCPARPFSAIYVEGHERHRVI